MTKTERKHIALFLGILAVSGIAIATTYDECKNIIQVLMDDPEYEDYQTVLDNYATCRQNVVTTTTTTTIPSEPKPYFKSYAQLNSLLHNFIGTPEELNKILEYACYNSVFSNDVQVFTIRFVSSPENLEFKCYYQARYKPKNWWDHPGTFWNVMWSTNYPSNWYPYCTMTQTQLSYDIKCTKTTFYNQWFVNSDTGSPWVIQ